MTEESSDSRESKHDSRFKLLNFYRHGVVRSASLLLGSSAIMAVSGFVFWAIAAREFTAIQVGVASVVFTSASLVTTIGLLGLDSGVLRFLGKATDPRRQLESSITLAAIFTAVAGGGYLWLAPWISPQLGYLSHGVLRGAVVEIFMVSLAVFALLQATFIARRRAGFVLVQSSLFSVAKLVTLVALTSYGALGIIGATTIGALVCCFLGVFLVWRLYGELLRPVITRRALLHLRSYVSSVFVAGIQVSFIQAVIPILVIHRLGPSQAGSYYIALSAASVLNFIPSTSFQSLVAEGAHDIDDLALHVNRSARHVFLLLLPAGAVGLVLAPYGLAIFGANYSHSGTAFLRILIMSSLFVALNYMADGVALVRQRNSLFLWMNTFNSAAILIFSFLLVHQGLVGLGWAWLIAQAMTVAGYSFILRKDIPHFIRPS